MFSIKWDEIRKKSNMRVYVSKEKERVKRAGMKRERRKMARAFFLPLVEKNLRFSRSENKKADVACAPRSVTSRINTRLNYMR